MMLQKPSGRMAKFKYLLIIPVMLGMALLISAKQSKEQTGDPEDALITTPGINTFDYYQDSSDSRIVLQGETIQLRRYSFR